MTLWPKRCSKWYQRLACGTLAITSTPSDEPRQRVIANESVEATGSGRKERERGVGGGGGERERENERDKVLGLLVLSLMGRPLSPLSAMGLRQTRETMSTARATRGRGRASAAQRGDAELACARGMV
jgi:hypothetical protein